ncbi:general substrate transporter [Apiosordaria backusii]|uniref:General substrate transporter n=1 Tax=Apiosordaria backusii TaxID=314023 RepID=A0AA40K6I3_9PEZI|nr:general substrate transporter [Apiosordaria backusii]
MSSAQDPLISASEQIDAGDEDNHRDEGRLESNKPGPASPSLFIWLLTLSAGISGLLFGCVISSTLISLGSSLSNRPLTALDKSIITSSTSLFALLVSPFSSVLADSLGRKRVILVADVLFILGAGVQAACSTVWVMVVGRSIVGMAVGAASFVVPLYIAELAPAEHRGRLVTMNVIFITLGQVVAYIVGYGFGEYGHANTAWRWMVGLGGVPAVVQLFMMMAMPETPRWLVMVGRGLEAKGVVEKVAGGKVAAREVDATVKGIEIEVREEQEGRRLRRRRAHGVDGKAGWVEGFDELFSIRRNRRALAIACLLQGLQQLCGFNSLMYFSATIFEMLGFPIPTLTSLVVAVTNFVFTLAALLIIDRVGRRRILLWSIPFMVIGLLLAAFGFSSIELSSSNSAGSTTAQGNAIVILMSIMVYVAGYAIGLGNVPWMQSELFALNVRSLGSGIATATNWGANFVIGLTFLLLMDALTPTVTFALYALICVGGYVLIWKFYPETAGLSLEEAASLLEDDNWGVR